MQFIKIKERKIFEDGTKESTCLFASEVTLTGTTNSAFSPFKYLPSNDQYSISYDIKKVECNGILVTREHPPKITIGLDEIEFDYEKIAQAFISLGVSPGDKTEYKIWTSEEQDVFLECAYAGFKEGGENPILTIAVDDKAVGSRFSKAYGIWKKKKEE